MIPRRAVCRSALQRGNRTKLEAIWITDGIISRVLHRFYLSRISWKRDASSVPGPMESRKRTGKRRIANLSEAAKVPGQDFGALWGVDGSLERQQWQWEGPSKRQPLRTTTDKPRLPAWLSEYRPVLDVPAPVFRSQGSELAGLSENFKAIEDQLCVFGESLRASSTDHFEDLCESYNHCFGRNLVLGLVSESLIYKNLEVVTEIIQEVITDKLLASALCLHFYAAVWNGIKASKVLRPIDLGSGLLTKLLVLLGRLPCSAIVQSMASDIIQTTSHDQLDGMRKGISHVIRAWLSSWKNLEVSGSQTFVEEMIVYDFKNTSYTTQPLLDSVRALAKFLDELPRFMIQRTILRTTKYLVSTRFASFKGTCRRLRLLRYAWVSAIAKMPCVKEKLLFEVWTRMDTFNSEKNVHEHVPSIPRLSLHENCTLLLEFWINKGQIKAPESVTAMFAASVQKFGQLDSIVHLIQAMDQCGESWGRKAEFLFRFLRNLGKPEAVYCAFQKLVAKNLSPPIYVFAREVQEMSLIDPRRALNIYKLHHGVQNNGAQLLVDFCPNLVLAMIKSPSFHAGEIWAILNITRINLPAASKPVHSSRVRLVQQMALAFAGADFRSPRVSLRNVLRCMLFLRRNGVPVSTELSRALTEVGITRSVLDGRWVGREKADWILDVIEKAEGHGVRTRVEQIWEESLMKGIVHQQRLKREANPLRIVGSIQ